MCSYVASNEIKLYVLSDQAKSYAVTQTSSEKSFLQKFNQDDKNCLSTKKYSSEDCPVRPVCNDKNCQSAKFAHMQKSAMPQSNYKKVTHPNQLYRKQIGTQLEVIRNCQDSTGKHCYPPRNTNMCPDVAKSQSNHMLPVTAEPKKSQINTKLQVKTSK